MAWLNSSVLDALLNNIKTNANKMCAISAYTNGDSYATVNANILAEVTMSSTDYTIASSGNDRYLVTASGKQDASANATGNPVAIAFVNTATSSVLWVTAETGSVSTVGGLPVDFPQVTLTAHQP